MHFVQRHTKLVKVKNTNIFTNNNTKKSTKYEVHLDDYVLPNNFFRIRIKVTFSDHWHQSLAFVAVIVVIFGVNFSCFYHQTSQYRATERKRKKETSVKMTLWGGTFIDKAANCL